MRSIKLITALSIALASSTALAALTPEQVKSKIEATLGSKVESVKATEIKGIYEVFANDNIAYTNEEGRFFLIGHLFDMKTRTDLTQARLDELGVGKIDTRIFKKEDAIKTVYGNGSREMFVFVDPDCGHCQTLEKNLQQVKDVTVYSYLLPLSKHDRSNSIWCSSDKSAALKSYMIDGVKPSLKDDMSHLNPKCDLSAIERNVKLAQELGVTGTPAIVFADGSAVPGALPADKIEQLLESQKPRKANSAGAK